MLPRWLPMPAKLSSGKSRPSLPNRWRTRTLITRTWAVLEFKKREMEQQVEIVKLEKELNAARHRLGAMRRAGYHTDETD
ncbi:hypothetical protein MPER_10777 [Moniliophthora perniciosa FA553]|nr:hypothetical protein MPER_10777 [Moniliophthora perniciosa FA553]